VVEGLGLSTGGDRQKGRGCVWQANKRAPGPKCDVSTRRGPDTEESNGEDVLCPRSGMVSAYGAGGGATPAVDPTSDDPNLLFTTHRFERVSYYLEDWTSGVCGGA
jgi:hypothetical protein